MPVPGGPIGLTILPLTVFAGLALAPASLRAEERTDLFRQAAPILEKHCLSCHGGSAKKGGLSLATLADAREGGDIGPAIVAGKPEESLLLDAISGPKPRMPRKAPPLAREQVEVLKKW